MKAFVLSWLIFLSMAGAAMAQEFRPNFIVTAFCMPTEQAGLAKVRSSLETGDTAAYKTVMEDPATECYDIRHLQTQPIRTQFVRTIGQEFFTSEKVCLQFAEFRDAAGSAGVTWINCKGTPA